MDENVRRGSLVEIDGIRYEVTSTENYGFFVRGRKYIVLWSDEYKVIQY